jgi:hypothetical protein
MKLNTLVAIHMNTGIILSKDGFIIASKAVKYLSNKNYSTLSLLTGARLWVIYLGDQKFISNI